MPEGLEGSSDQTKTGFYQHLAPPEHHKMLGRATGAFDIIMAIIFHIPYIYAHIDYKTATTTRLLL